MSKVNPEPMIELANDIFDRADGLVDSDPLELRDLAFAAARLLHTAGYALPADD